MDNITIIIRDQEFVASKASLTEKSDYFRAMFSGNYVENDQTKIKIDVFDFDPNVMSIILNYIRIGCIDLSEHSLTTIEELAMAANFLQITDLIKQIVYTLEDRLSPSTWVEIVTIAKTADYMNLESISTAYGLFCFKLMEPKYIPTIQKLFWYLSHPYLDVEIEFEVFKFGHKWIMQNQSGGDALLLILCCLDYTKLTVKDLQNMMGLLQHYPNSLAEKIIECLNESSDLEKQFSTSYFTEQKSEICIKYTERVYTEVVNLIEASIKRKLLYTPIVPMWMVRNKIPEMVPHYLYKCTKENGFDKWLEIAEKNLWGWSAVLWGLTKIVVTCGEYTRGSGIFMNSVKVYDILKEEWTQHGVKLPNRRHAGVAIIGDTLYIVGGIGSYRVLQDGVISYDLKDRTFRKLASLPDALQNPAICAHENMVYVCGQRDIYRYEESNDLWQLAVNTNIRINCMVSFKGYIYCTQNYFSSMYRFKPGEDDRLQMVTSFSSPVDTFCNIRDCLLAFTKGDADEIKVEKFDDSAEAKTTVLWREKDNELRVNNVVGCFVVVTKLPPVNVAVSETHLRSLKRFPEE